jgi:signal transduction histidine kinase/CheY-like chemotaxis protein
MSLPFPASDRPARPTDHRPDADEPELAGLRQEIDRLQAGLAQAQLRLAEQGEALERATHAAEAAADARDRFISSVSHELRTPLSAILLWSSLIDEQQVDDPQLSEALNAIKRSAEEQSALIDDIVDTSRLLAGKLRLEPESVDLAALLHEAAAAVAADAQGQGLTLVEEIASDLPPMKVDARRFRQLVTYLLRNAIKFTPRSGRVTLAARLPPGAAELAVAVSDTGAGLSASELQDLFSRAPRLEGKCARSEMGLGLGLLLADRLARLHGGRLRAESPGLGGGATFTVALPRPAATTAAPSPGQAGARTRRVLLFQLPEAARVDASACIEAAGAHAIAASSPESADAAARAQPVDLIVAGLGPPSAAGLELLARIRAGGQPAFSRTTPAIALLPTGDPAQLDRALEAGYQTALTLPVDAGELAATLHALLPAPVHG